jgi:hypothetical protein
MFPNHLTQARPRRASCYRPHLDPLEERTLLSLTTFTVDDTQSFLTLSGGVGSIQLMQQAAGSLVTAYTGNLQADVDFPNGLIMFIKGDGVMAENSGDWQPRADGSLGSEPANYGGQINFLGMARFAFRDIDLRLSSDPLPLTPLGAVSYGFPNNQHIKMHHGRVAYNHPLLGPGTTGLGRFAGNNDADSKGNASYLTDVNGDGSTLELHLAVDFSFTARIHHVQVNLNLDGMIVATGSLGAGPAASHAVKGTGAALGTALVAGAHAHGQASATEPLGNLTHPRASAVQPTALTDPASSTPSAGVGSVHVSVDHQAAVEQLDAAFAELNPIEQGMM